MKENLRHSREGGNPAAQRGVAVVTAILVVAVAASTAAWMLAQQSATLNQTALAASRAQADLFAQAGLDWARGILAEDARAGGADTLAEGWAQPLAGLPVERALVSGAIADAQSRFNLNNVVVNAFNHGFSVAEFIDGLTPGTVRQVHLAGHEDRRDYLFDTHDAPVPEDVWAAYRLALRRFGPLPTLIERDDHIPPLEVLLAERDHAAAIEVDELRARSA